MMGGAEPCLRRQPHFAPPCPLFSWGQQTWQQQPSQPSQPSHSLQQGEGQGQRCNQGQKQGQNQGQNQGWQLQKEGSDAKSC